MLWCKFRISGFPKDYDSGIQFIESLYVPDKRSHLSYPYFSHLERTGNSLEYFRARTNMWRRKFFWLKMLHFDRYSWQMQCLFLFVRNVSKSTCDQLAVLSQEREAPQQNILSPDLRHRFKLIQPHTKHKLRTNQVWQKWNCIIPIKNQI